MSYLKRNDLEGILGWHDGARVTTVSEALNSPHVLIHESIHGRLFHETADGQLHRACCQAARSDYDRQLGGVYTALARFLLDDTREAHEAAATYLGIQGLTTAAERAEEYERLPEDYRRYYAVLSEPIDRVSGSSWLRSAFAWTLSHWAFHSKRAHDFFKVEIPDSGTVDEVKAIPSPSRRLREAARMLEGDRLQEWRDFSIAGARALCAKRGLELWDVDDEDEWDARRMSDAPKMFENYLNHAAAHWLLDNLAIETADYRDPDPKLGPGLDKLMKALGFRLVSYYRGRDTELDPAARPGLLRRRAFEHGDDAIVHSPWCIPRDIESADAFMNEAAQCLPATSDLFFISDIRSKQDPSDPHLGADRMLILFQSRQDSAAAEAEPYFYREVGSYRVPFDLAVRFAQAFIGRKRGGGFPHIRMWALLSAGRATLREAIDRCIPFSFDLDAIERLGPAQARVIPTERIMLYWHDNWAVLDEYEGTQATSMLTAFADSDSAPKRLSVRIAQIEGLVCSFIIAAKNAWAGGSLDEYEQERIATGKQVQLDLPADLALTQAFAPLIVAWTVWPRF